MVDKKKTPVAFNSWADDFKEQINNAFVYALSQACYEFKWNIGSDDCVICFLDQSPRERSRFQERVARPWRVSRRAPPRRASR